MKWFLSPQNWRIHCTITKEIWCGRSKWNRTLDSNRCCCVQLQLFQTTSGLSYQGGYTSTTQKYFLLSSVKTTKRTKGSRSIRTCTVCLYSIIRSLTEVPGSGGAVKRTRMLLAGVRNTEDKNHLALHLDSLFHSWFCSEQIFWLFGEKWKSEWNIYWNQ